jgi:hypothetical protein
MHLFLKILKWTGIVLVGGFVILVIVRMFHFANLDKTNAEVEKIHATKLTLDDVMGKNLPPAPGADANKTVAGIDANNNGIRDDVELAIFNTYTNTAKTRAVLLQYALALQMEATQSVINTDTVVASVQEEDRAYACVGKILSQKDKNKYFLDWDKLVLFIENLEFNTPDRKQAKEDFLKKIGSYNAIDRNCDIDYSTLPN